MKLADARDQYYINSGKLSDVCRQLSFSGIAVIWIVITIDKPINCLEMELNELLLPLMFFIVSLGFDLIQYAYASLAWGLYHRYKEKKIDEETEFFASPKINWLTIIFFWLKVIALAIGYCFLVTSLWTLLVC